MTEQNKSINGVVIIPNSDLHTMPPFSKGGDKTYAQLISEFLYAGGFNLPGDLYKRFTDPEAQEEMTYKDEVSLREEVLANVVGQGFCAMLYTDGRYNNKLTVYLPSKLGTEQSAHINGVTPKIVQKINTRSILVCTLDEEDKKFGEKKESTLDELVGLVEKLHSPVPKFGGSTESKKHTLEQK